MPTPEGRIEDYLLDKCRKNGILCWKFVSPSQNGVPDRILMHKGHVLFVELKAPGESPRPDQLAVHRIMLAHGIKVFVADSTELCDEIVDGLLKRRKKRMP